MTDWDDPSDMPQDGQDWTEFDVERVVSGGDGDAPDGLGSTAELFRVARGPAEGDETTDRVGIATALASSTQVLPIVAAASKWRTPRRIATVAVAAALLSSGVAAAATNGFRSADDRTATTTTLADGQSTTTTSLEGITSTSEATDFSTTTTELTTEPTTTEAPQGVGPVVPGPSLHGLCTAFGERTQQPGNSVAYRNLADAAAAAGQSVNEYCAMTTTTTAMPSAPTIVHGPMAQHQPGHSADAHGKSEANRKGKG